MPSEPLWLAAEEVEQTNLEAVSETGEAHALTNPAGLHIACASPQNYYYYEGETDIRKLTTVFLFSLARNHPFEQGNKRTALISALMFLEQNGYVLNVPNTDGLGQCVNSVIEGELSENDFFEMLKASVIER